MPSRIYKVIAFVLAAAAPLVCQATMRFPHPEFESGYSVPTATRPSARSLALEYGDLAVLCIVLGLTCYLALTKRSRRSIFLLTVFSFLYFGFWRLGCVCSVGSIQNIALALFDNGYAVPLTVVMFFTIPLLFSLFFGRVFCAAACPLGAMQDLVVVHPMRVPRWLAHALGIVPYLYLGLAVLVAAVGADFVICRYDPFIGFYRLGAPFAMLITGACFLLLGTVIARPYCRFLCPYGVLLNWTSRLARRHVTITPGKCIQCRLCEDSCPFDAILAPTPEKVTEDRPTGLRRLAILIATLPVLAAAGVWIGSAMHVPLSRMHPDVRLADRVALEVSGAATDISVESQAFRESGKPATALFAEAASLQSRFLTGSRLLGGFIGLVIGLQLINLSIRRRRKDYVPDKGACFSCGRCFSYCPVEGDKSAEG